MSCHSICLSEGTGPTVSGGFGALHEKSKANKKKEIKFFMGNEYFSFCQNNYNPGIHLLFSKF
jgi:hypothetical protein